MLQHADDCTNFVEDSYSYNEILKEFNLFGKVSGSKINPDKTEILLLGNWRGKRHAFPLSMIKAKVKTLRVNFGINDEKQNLQEIREKIRENIKIWALTPICLLERAQVAKNYMYVHLNYKLKSIDISNAMLKNIYMGI